MNFHLLGKRLNDGRRKPCRRKLCGWENVERGKKSPRKRATSSGLDAQNPTPIRFIFPRSRRKVTMRPSCSRSCQMTSGQFLSIVAKGDKTRPRVCKVSKGLNAPSSPACSSRPRSCRARPHSPQCRHCITAKARLEL